MQMKGKRKCIDGDGEAALDNVEGKELDGRSKGPRPNVVVVL